MMRTATRNLLSGLEYVLSRPGHWLAWPLQPRTVDHFTAWLMVLSVATLAWSLVFMLAR